LQQPPAHLASAVLVIPETEAVAQHPHDLLRTANQRPRFPEQIEWFLIIISLNPYSQKARLVTCLFCSVGGVPRAVSGS
jgi:hypothetical protein